jgi:sugar (pentulose or hexulose) kinase
MPTTPAGLPYPLGTDPVANGAQDIQDLAEAVDPGLGLYRVTPSAVSGTGVTIDANGDVVLTAAPDSYITCFSAKFRNYRVILSITGFQGGAQGIQMRPANGTTPFTTAADYRFTNLVQSTANGTVLTGFNAGTDAFLAFGRVDGGNNFASVVVDIFSPFESTQRLNYVSQYRDFSFGGTHHGQIQNLNSFNGMNIRLNGTNTITGRISIYGYRN